MNDEQETSGASDDRFRAELVETIRQCLHYPGPIDGRTEISDLIHDSIDLVELITVVSERYEVRSTSWRWTACARSTTWWPT